MAIVIYLVILGLFAGLMLRTGGQELPAQITETGLQRRFLKMAAYLWHFRKKRTGLLLWPGVRRDLQIMQPEFFNQLIGVHALIMIFAALMPAATGFANWPKIWPTDWPTNWPGMAALSSNASRAPGPRVQAARAPAHDAAGTSEDPRGHLNRKGGPSIRCKQGGAGAAASQRCG